MLLWLLLCLLAEGSVADVATVLHTLEGDFSELGIGLVEGGTEIGGGSGDGEDTAAGGDELVVFEDGAGVEDYDICSFGG